MYVRTFNTESMQAIFRELCASKNAEADDQFEPTSDHAGAPAGSTNSSADFDPGFDDEFDSEVNLKHDFN